MATAPTSADPAGAPRLRRRKRRVVPAPPPLPEFHAAAPSNGASLSPEQLREARRIRREKQIATRKERALSERLVATLTEGQNALNIAFGAILSAYIGNMLTAIDDHPFDPWLLAGFFTLIGVFIGGLCVGNTILLRRHFKLGAAFLGVGAAAAWLTLQTAAILGFELPILRVLFLCWFAMLLLTDGVLTLIVFLHHQQLV